MNPKDMQEPENMAASGSPCSAWLGREDAAYTVQVLGGPAPQIFTRDPTYGWAEAFALAAVEARRLVRAGWPDAHVEITPAP